MKGCQELQEDFVTSSGERRVGRLADAEQPKQKDYNPGSINTTSPANWTGPFLFLRDPSWLGGFPSSLKPQVKSSCWTLSWDWFEQVPGPPAPP